MTGWAIAAAYAVNTVQARNGARARARMAEAADIAEQLHGGAR